MYAWVVVSSQLEGRYSYEVSIEAHPCTVGKFTCPLISYMSTSHPFYYSYNISMHITSFFSRKDVVAFPIASQV